MTYLCHFVFELFVIPIMKTLSKDLLSWLVLFVYLVMLLLLIEHGGLLHVFFIGFIVFVLCWG